MRLHDVGVVGLLAAAPTVIATALACRPHGARARDPADRADHEALALGLAGVVGAWQATHGFWQMYGYMAFGLLLALHAVARRERPRRLAGRAVCVTHGRPSPVVGQVGRYWVKLRARRGAREPAARGVLAVR